MPRSQPERFAAPLPKENKLAGRTPVFATPLEVRGHQVELPRGMAGYIRRKLGTRLGKFAGAIERVIVRFEDINGPNRGGEDIVCRVQILLPRKRSEIVEARGVNSKAAFDVVSHAVATAVRKATGKARLSEGSGKRARGAAAAAAGRRSKGRTGGGPGEPKSRPGRVKGVAEVSPPLLHHTRGTAAITEPDQRGGPANRLGTTSRATHQIETTTGTPSRKSTRRGANRVKPDTNLTKRMKVAVNGPQQTAMRAMAGRGTRRH
jgi:hypothetical protein